MRAGDDTPGLAVFDRTLPAARGAVVTTLLNIALMVLKQRYRLRLGLDGNEFWLKSDGYLDCDGLVGKKEDRVQ